MKEILHIYIRVSSETQSQDGFGLDVQEEWGRELCEKIGFTPVIHNEGSAKSSNDNLEKRPVLMELLSKMETGEIKHIYVYNNDRLSRNQQTWGLIRYKIKSNNVLLYSGKNTSPQDLSDPTQDLIFGVMSEISIYDNLLRRDRLTSGKFKKVKEGGWMGGPPPYGYKNVDGYLVVDPVESKWVIRMFEDYLRGDSTGDIKEMLMSNGVLTRRGRVKFSLGSIRNIIGKNTHYNGSYIVTDRSRDEVISCNCPPIVSPKLYIDVRKEFKKRSYKESGRIKEGRELGEYLTKEFLRCGHCNSSFGVRVNPNQYRNHYFCRGKENEWNNSGNDKTIPCKNRVRSIKIDQTDKVIWESVCDILENSHIFKETFKDTIEETEMTSTKSKTVSKKNTKRLKEIKSDIEKIQGYKTTNISQNIIAELPENQLRDLLGKFDDEISKLRVEQETIELEQKGISEKNNWVDWVKMFGKNMEDLRSPETTFNDKKKMLKSIINSIIVLSDDKTSHRLVINLSVNWWNDNLSWTYKTNKDGKRIKDGYILDQGEDVFTTDWINTKKN